MLGQPHARAHTGMHARTLSSSMSAAWRSKKRVNLWAEAVEALSFSSSRRSRCRSWASSLALLASSCSAVSSVHLSSSCAIRSFSWAVESSSDVVGMRALRAPVRYRREQPCGRTPCAPAAGHPVCRRGCRMTCCGRITCWVLQDVVGEEKRKWRVESVSSHYHTPSRELMAHTLTLLKHESGFDF